MNSRIDLERQVTEWLRVEAPERAPERVLAITLDRIAVVGQERSLGLSLYRDRSGTSRTLLIAATVALLAVVVAAAVLVGGQLLSDKAPLPVPSAPPAFAPTPPPVPVAPPTTIVGTGAASTELASAGARRISRASSTNTWSAT